MAGNHMIGQKPEPGPHTLSEDVLIAQALQGQHDAVGELIRRYQNAVFNLCYRMLGDYDEAENAAQEVFIKMYRRLHTYKPTYRFSTWVLSIASHHCIDHLRKRRIVRVPLDTPEIQQYAHAHSVDPEKQALLHEDAETLQRYLNLLPEEQRLVLILHYWYDLSYREIANILHTTEGAVKTKAHRARRRLGKMLKQHESL